ncbi:hypothetical protein F0U61_15075 [Archangium violaceum]|uniref:hypothetical protein n=1 Tax=Archangium violaceum TaxID=83451 RepID=UPI002B306D21|nr:hypothetical protein F0U61_15075 [Archangium violaceum]
MPSEQVSRRRWIRIACSSAHAPLSLFVVLVVLASCPVACASHPPPDALAATRDALAGLDDFGALLLGAGLPVEAIPQGRSVSPVQAERLRRYFALLPYLPQHYAPRIVADELLRYVEQHRQEVSRWDLSRMVQEYRNLFLLRQDGYLAAALTGEPAQCVGPVEVRDDGAGAGEFEIGEFYTRRDGESWRRADRPNLDKL